MVLASSEGQERVEVFQSSASVETARAWLFTGMLFGEARGLQDDNGTTLYGAASLRTGAPLLTGEKISVGCLVKLEVNQQV
jgi:hypothetical protein